MYAGDLLLSGGRDATIRVWDLDVKCCRRTLPGHTADVLHLAVLSPKRPRNPAPNPAPPELPVDSMPFALVDTPAPEGSAVDMLPCVLVSCSADGTCRLWDVRTWTCVKVITPMPAPPASSTAGSNAPCRTTGTVLALNVGSCWNCCISQVKVQKSTYLSCTLHYWSRTVLAFLPFQMKGLQSLERSLY